MILAIDCAANLCAASVYDEASATELGREVRDLGKGHAEHLMDVIAAALSRAGKTYQQLDRLVVSVGPGSFTGIRVGISAARGLSLALSRPLVGVTTLQAIAAEAFEHAQTQHAAAVLAAIDAGRDGIYVGVYDRFGTCLYNPSIMTLGEAARLASRQGFALAGSASGGIAAQLAEAQLTGNVGATADIGVYSRLGAAMAPQPEKPRPLYLRAPDAKPQASFVLPRRGV